MSIVLRLRDPVLKKRRPRGWGGGGETGHCPQIPEELSQSRRTLVLCDCKGPGKMVRGNPLGDSFYQSELSNQETVSAVMQAGGHAGNWFLPRGKRLDGRP